jgi:hypothetical protein
MLGMPKRTSYTEGSSFELKIKNLELKTPKTASILRSLSRLHGSPFFQQSKVESNLKNANGQRWVKEKRFFGYLKKRTWR